MSEIQDHDHKPYAFAMDHNHASIDAETFDVYALSCYSADCVMTIVDEQRVTSEQCYLNEDGVFWKREM